MGFSGVTVGKSRSSNRYSLSPQRTVPFSQSMRFSQSRCSMRKSGLRSMTSDSSLSMRIVTALCIRAVAVRSPAAALRASVWGSQRVTSEAP